MKKILIQLVGGQTLPNIISLLSVVPDEVVNIYTKTTKDRREDIERWCHKYGRDFGLSPTFLKVDAVSEKFEELIRNLGTLLTELVEKCRKEEDTLLILNATGATKPMSAMSMSICQRLEQKSRAAGKELVIPIFYVNTGTRSFDFFAHGEMRGEVLAHEAFTRKMSVRQIIDATSRVELKGYRDWWPAYPAAKMLWKGKSSFNLVNITRDNAETVVQLGISAQQDSTRNPKYNPGRMVDFVREAGKDPEVVKSMEACGFEWRNGDFYYNKNLKAKAARIAKLLSGQQDKKARDEINKQLGDIQNAQNFWVGGWWEVIVAHAYQTKHPEAEVLWSVETADRKTGKAGVETDVIATDGFSLCCISCKRGMHKGVVQELEQHCARSEMLGGVVNSRAMAMYYKDEEMRTLTRVLNIQLWPQKMVQAMEERKPMPTAEEKEAAFNRQEEPPPPTLARKDSAQQEKTAEQPENAPAQPEAAKPMSLGQRLAAAWRILTRGRA